MAESGTSSKEHNHYGNRYYDNDSHAGISSPGRYYSAYYAVSKRSMYGHTHHNTPNGAPRTVTKGWEKIPAREATEMKDENCKCGNKYDGYNISPMQADDGHNYPCCTECGKWEEIA